MMHSPVSPPCLQFLSKISNARGSIPGAEAKSLRLSGYGRVEKNMSNELTKGPALAVETRNSSEFGSTVVRESDGISFV